MSILKLLSSSNFLVINKSLIKKIGLHNAIILSELCHEHNTWENKEMLDDGWFYSTYDNISENTGLSEKQIAKSIKFLSGAKFDNAELFMENPLIECKLKGLPATMHYRILQDNLENLFLQKVNSSYDKKAELDTTKSKNININNNKNSKNININNNKNSNNNNNKEYKNIQKESETNKIFEFFRQTYPGTKRGLAIELKEMQKHKDWIECLDLLQNALTKEMEYKRLLEKKKVFVPQWKNLGTWIKQRCWEQEFATIDDGKLEFERGHDGNYSNLF